MKKTQLSTIIFTTVSIILIVACTTKKVTTATKVETKVETKTETTTPIKSASISYTNTAKVIIDKNCAGCHREYSSYNAIKNIIDNGSFKHEVIETREMPKREPLSADDYNTLKAWLEAGAPEN